MPPAANALWPDDYKHQLDTRTFDAKPYVNGRAAVVEPAVKVVQPSFAPARDRSWPNGTPQQPRRELSAALDAVVKAADLIHSAHERAREAEERASMAMEQAAEQVRTAEGQSRAAQERAREAEDRVRALVERAAEQIRQAEAQARAAEERAEAAMKRAQVSDERARVATERSAEQLKAAETRLHSLEESLRSVEARAAEQARQSEAVLQKAKEQVFSAEIRAQEAKDDLLYLETQIRERLNVPASDPRSGRPRFRSSFAPFIQFETRTASRLTPRRARSPVGLVEGISCSTHGPNGIVSADLVEGLAQTSDMDVDGAVVDIDILPPDSVQELRA
jgi:hypothetical protein